MPKDYTLPRAELFAAVVNTHTGEIVKRSLKNLHKTSTKLTDSQIALYWISNDDKPLKKWVRSPVLEIQRFTNKQQWFYIPSDQNLADIGTRRGVTFKEVNQSSLWINGHQWMKQPKSFFPIQSTADIKLSNQQINEVAKEQTIIQSVYHFSPFKEISERYKFSRYLLDPNRRRFTSIIRIIALVFKYIYILLDRARNKIRNRPIAIDQSCNLHLSSSVMTRFNLLKHTTSERHQKKSFNSFQSRNTKTSLRSSSARILPVYIRIPLLLICVMFSYFDFGMN